jgi:hypothetical protein
MSTCSDCHFWHTDDPVHTWAAPCDLGIIAKPEAWQSCTHFTDRQCAAAEKAMQSECQPVTMPVFQMWQQAMRGKP